MKTRAHVLLSATALLASLSFGAAAGAQEAQRQGGRFGVALHGGLASTSDGNGGSSSTGLVGPTLRFGGAITDRFHLLGELHLLVLPGATLPGYGGATAFHAALDLAGQGYIGPRFFVRAGAGVGWASAVAGNRWVLPLPGPRVSGALGYDVWRSGETSLSVSLESSYTVLYNARGTLDALFTLGASVGFDWY